MHENLPKKNENSVLPEEPIPGTSKDPIPESSKLPDLQMKNEKSVQPDELNPGNSKDPTPGSSKLRSRSVSLNRIPGGAADSPEKKCSKSKGYTKRKRDSPPPKDGIKTKRMIFEDKLARKYQAQRNAKESARNKMKTKKEKTKK